MWYFPDVDAFSLNFETCDFESTLLLSNVGFMLWILALHLLIFIIHLMIFIVQRVFKCCQNLRKKIGNYLYWNGILRLYLEVIFDLSIMSVLNIYTAAWDSSFQSEKVSNAISICLLALLVLVPVVFVPFLFCKRRQWND